MKKSNPRAPASAGKKPNHLQQTERQKPSAIWSHTTGGTTISVVPRNIGRVAVRIGHHEGQYYRALCCSLMPSRLSVISLDASIGTIILDGVDVMSPELCNAKEYRDDGYGYTKHLVVMRVSAEATVWSVTCTLCARDSNGHICSAGDYCHTISVRIDNKTLEAMLQSVEHWSIAQQVAGKTHTIPSPEEKALDIHVADGYLVLYSEMKKRNS